MLNIIESIRMRLKRRVGCFGLYGYDFMIDEQMKVWLIEINVNPALTTNTKTLTHAIPPVVEESIRQLPILLLFFIVSLLHFSSRHRMFPQNSTWTKDLSVEIFERIQMYLQ